MSNNYVMPTFNGVVKGSEEYNKILAERSKIRKDALADVMSYVNGLDNTPENITAALNCLKRQASGFASTGSGKNTRIAELFTKVGDELTEDTIFSEFKLGRSEMRAITKTLILKNNLWISFNPESGIYKLEGKGQNQPKGWKGYVPKDKVTVEDGEFTEAQV